MGRQEPLPPWGVLKVCGLVGLLGHGVSAFLDAIVTGALDAVIPGQVQA